MSKMRIYEYAKKNNLKSKDVIEKLQQLEIEVSNHMSTITDGTINILNKEFGLNGNKEKKEENKTESKPKQSNKKEAKKPNKTQNQQANEKKGNESSSKNNNKKK